MTDDELKSCVLLSVQRALWDVISPSLRAVAVNWDNRLFTMRCFFHPAPTEEEADDMSDVEGDVCCDLPEHFEYERQLFEVSGPLPQDPGFVWVFARKEPGNTLGGQNLREPAPLTRETPSAGKDAEGKPLSALDPKTAWTSIEFRCQVLLSLQRALLGAVSPSLRAVRVNGDLGVITIRCYVEAASSEENWEDMRNVEARVMADLPEEFKTDLQLLEVDGRLPDAPGFSYVFSRKEPEYLEGYP